MNTLQVYSLVGQPMDALQPTMASPSILGDNWTLFLMVLKMCLMLGAICLLAFVTLRYVLPRLAGLPTSAVRIMKVVARFPLEPHKSLYIVEVTGKHLLLGVTQERIEVLSELNAEAVQQALDSALIAATKPSPLLQAGSTAVKEFSKYLRR